MTGPVINLLYGDQWGQAVPVAQLLCVGALVTVSISFSKHALIASGNIKRIFMTQLIVQPMNVIVILFFAREGLEAIATGLVIVAMLNVQIVHWHLRRAINISFRNYWQAVRLSLLVAMVVLIPAVIVNIIYHGEEISSLTLLLTALVTGLVWVASIFLLNHPIAKEFGSFLKLVKR